MYVWFLQKAAGVRLLALDWDLTVLNTHTRGRWINSSVDLAAHVRPAMRNLILAAMEAQLPVSIVTFSTQNQLIQDTLQHALHPFDASSIFVRCSQEPNQAHSSFCQVNEQLPVPGYRRMPSMISSNFASLHQNQNQQHQNQNQNQRVGESPGKMPHLVSAANNLVDFYGSQPQANQIVLIDDDGQNIAKAAQHGIVAVKMDPFRPNLCLRSLATLLSS